jgi:hypothetical protein
MKNLIICISILFVFAACKNNTEDKVAIQFKGYVNFVDSIEKFNSDYKTKNDTVITEQPISNADPSAIKLDTIIITHKSLFENSSKYSTDIISFYMLKSEIIDSMDKANCFTQEQRNELQTAKKKFDKMVAEGALAN